jgi:MOSC domain-containing protein YiiM
MPKNPFEILPINRTLSQLRDELPHPGKVVWLGLRPERNAPMIEPSQVCARTGSGLEGDRFNGNALSKRQVTLIQAEHLAVVASLLRRDTLTPALLRRNIVVSGLNLLALKEKTFAIGEAVFEMTGLCHPCSKMEILLGQGGYNAMRGHGGITARVVKSGLIKIGHTVSVMARSAAGEDQNQSTI